MIDRPSPTPPPFQPALAAFTADQAQRPTVLRERTGFFVFFAETIDPLLEAQRPVLNAFYHPTLGCPALDPVLLQGVGLLQFVERLPDRQAAEAVGFDRRWRLALHLPEDFTGFDPSLLTVFRQRLVASDQERLIFEKVLDLLMEKGWVPRRCRQRLDSTHGCGLLSDMSRLECVRETLRLALEDLEREGWLPNFCVPFWDR